MNDLTHPTSGQKSISVASFTTSPTKLEQDSPTDARPPLVSGPVLASMVTALCIWACDKAPPDSGADGPGNPQGADEARGQGGAGGQAWTLRNDLAELSINAPKEKQP